MLEKYIAQRFNNRPERDHKAKDLRKAGYQVRSWKWNNPWTGAPVFHLEAKDPAFTGAVVIDSDGKIYYQKN